MYKLLFLITFGWLLFVSSARADHHIQWEVKGGAFHPNSPTFRKIYHDFQGIYSFEMSANIYPHLYGWMSTGYLLSKGYSLEQKYPTSVQYVPVGTGLSCKIPVIDYVDFYLGAGILAGYVQVQNHSPFIEDASKWAVGGIFKLKFLIQLPSSIFLDIFSDYSIMQFRFNNTQGGTIVPQTGDVSGFSFGLGIGYQYDYYTFLNKNSKENSTEKMLEN